MAYTWNKAAATNTPTRHMTQYFEMLGNRAIYHDGWIAATTPATLPWELSTKPAPDVITGYNWSFTTLAICSQRTLRRTTTWQPGCRTS